MGALLHILVSINLSSVHRPCVVRCAQPHASQVQCAGVETSITSDTNIGPGGLRAPCVLACAMRSLAIVFTIVQSFSLLVQACLRAPHVVVDEAKLAIVFT